MTTKLISYVFNLPRNQAMINMFLINLVSTSTTLFFTKTYKARSTSIKLFTASFISIYIIKNSKVLNETLIFIIFFILILTTILSSLFALISIGAETLNMIRQIIPFTNENIEENLLKQFLILID